MLWVPPNAMAMATNLPATPQGSAPGTTITASGTTGVKGAWTSLIDPVPFDTWLLHLNFHGTSTAATQTDMLVDIGIGPTGGGSEQVILSNLLAGWAPVGDRPGRQLVLPLFIPQGVRLSARAQALIVSDTVLVFAGIMGGGDQPMLPVLRGADAFGISGNIGTSHTPGASGAESAWANIGSTTAKDYIAALLMVQGTMATTASTGQGFHFELGYSSGAANLGEWWFGDSSNELDYGPYPPFPVFRSIPSGTQLQVRAEASGATPQAHDVAVYCFY